MLPLLAPGFVLAYDMVFVPRPHLSRELLGISRTLPRAVPIDLLVSLASRALTAMVVQKLVLIGIVAGGAYGAARLVPAEHPAARLGAGALYVWNPFVYERLLLGQWALLLGYALLPWTVREAMRFRRGERGAEWTIVLAVAVSAAASPYTGAFSVVLAGAILVCPPWAGRPGQVIGRVGWTVAVGVGVNLPWLVPAILHPPVPVRPALATELFRARADSPLGLIGSLVSLGGLWRTDLAPPGRSGYGWIPSFVLIAGLAVVGWGSLRRHWPAGARAALLGLAIAGLVVAASPSMPGMRTAVVWLVAHAPGGGFLRDSQKFAIPFALALSAGFGMGVDEALLRVQRAHAGAGRTAAARTGSRISSALPAVVLAILPVALAPTLAWGAGGKLSTAHYPASWARAESVMASDPAPGAALILPWHAYLPFGWNHDRTVHQPATRYFSRPVVAAATLEVGASVLPAEDPWSRLVDPIVRRSAPLESHLADSGVRYVLLFKEADWRSALPLVSGLARVLDAPDLSLYRSPGAARLLAFDAPAVAPVVAGDVVAGLLALGGVAVLIRRRGHPAGVSANRLVILRSRVPPEERSG